jgi:uncharacterized protein YkwD
MVVSPEERRKWERQVAALKEAETDDEGTPEWQAAMIAQANKWRAEHGIPPLKEWWETKTEQKLHERARALGLLGRVRRDAS